MSAASHIHPGQLKMFMSSNELMNDIEPGDFHGANAKEGWSHKLRESKASMDTGRHGSGVHKSVAKGGVRNPVEIYHLSASPVDGTQFAPRLMNGHHRVAAQADIDPERLIPVEHYSIDSVGDRRHSSQGWSKPTEHHQPHTPSSFDRQMVAWNPPSSAEGRPTPNPPPAPSGKPAPTLNTSDMDPLARILARSGPF